MGYDEARTQFKDSVNNALSWTQDKDNVTDPRSHGHSNNLFDSEDILSTYSGDPVLQASCGSFYFTLKKTYWIHSIL